MRLNVITGTAMALCLAFVVGTTAAPVANAITGDGTHWSSCSGRWTIAYRAWGSARMYVYGCSNGYVFTHLSSGSTWSKNVGITRDNPRNARYNSTTGYSYYAVTTNMLRYVKGTCYTAEGSSSDSGYGTQYVRWCWW